MTTLADDITYDQINIPISGPITDGTPRYPLYFQVDSEKIRVHDGLATTSWVIERGVAGTTAAAHSSGATLTRFSPEAIEIPSNGEQTIRLLGPFELTFETPGILADPFADIPLLDMTLLEGQMIINVFGVRTSAWNAPDNAEIDLWLGATSDPEGFADYTDWYHTKLKATDGAALPMQQLPWNFPVTFGGHFGTQFTHDEARIQPVLSTNDATKIGAYVVDEASSNLPSLSSGSLILYLLIAEPAS